MRFCTYLFCTKKHSAKGLCKEHYAYLRKPILNSVWYQNNKNKKAASSAKWFKENKERWTNYNAKLYLEKKELYNETSRLWRKQNPSKSKAYRAKYRASLLQATPKWADFKQIQKIYKNCPQGFEVDHYYPLQGKEVCGLHTAENLQYLPKTENRRKGNKLK